MIPVWCPMRCRSALRHMQTRPGAHCAPLMHKALGTEAQGVVRFSFGAMNDDADVDAAIAATKELASEFSGE